MPFVRTKRRIFEELECISRSVQDATLQTTPARRDRNTRKLEVMMHGGRGQVKGEGPRTDRQHESA
jgi:hypothetical protein